MPSLANRSRARAPRRGRPISLPAMALLGILAGCGAPRAESSTPPTAAAASPPAPPSGAASTSAPAHVPTTTERSGEGRATAEESAVTTEAEGSSNEAVRDFGAPFDTSIDPVALEAIVADPESYRDRTVRTSGTVARVCQRMGCWMELATTTGTTVRVPMAGHAFFLPRDVSGRPAEVVGRVVLEALPAETKAHLESEGARATTSSVALHAISVRVH